MNFIEAVKSDRFRRQGRTCWMQKSPNGNYFEFGDRGRAELSPKDVVADDWEIEESTVTITASQFWKAWEESLNETAGFREMSGALARRLGLETK